MRHVRVFLTLSLTPHRYPGGPPLSENDFCRVCVKSWYVAERNCREFLALKKKFERACDSIMLTSGFWLSREFFDRYPLWVL